MTKENTAFSVINVPPSSDGGSFHEDTLKFCRTAKNADAYEFCSTVAEKGHSAMLSSWAQQQQQQPGKATPDPMRVPSATPHDTKSVEQQQEEERKDSKCRFKPFHEEKWDQRLLELRAFRKREGHCLVPHTYPPNPQLARWVKRQRRQYKLMQDGQPSTMTPDRVVILEEDGFVWDSHEAAWKEKVEDLRKYRAMHGDCLVPSNYKGNPQLATWVKCQRRQHRLYWDGKPSAMNPTRIAELEAEGFRWELRTGSGSAATSGKSLVNNKGTLKQRAGLEQSIASRIPRNTALSQNELIVLHGLLSLS